MTDRQANSRQIVGWTLSKPVNTKTGKSVWGFFEDQHDALRESARMNTSILPATLILPPEQK